MHDLQVVWLDIPGDATFITNVDLNSDPINLVRFIAKGSVYHDVFLIVFNHSIFKPIGS